MNNHEPGSRLDAAIDQAVRQIMDVEPPPGLRRRVLSRLDRRTPGAAPVAWWPRLGLAAATVAAIVLAVVYLRPDPGLPAPEPVDVIAQYPAPIVPLPPVTPGADDERAEPTPSTPAIAAPAAGAGRQPRSERLPDPPRIDTVFGPEPDGRVTAASVAVPEALPDIEPLEVPPLPATLVTEAQDPPLAQEAKAASAVETQPAPIQNIRIDITLTEEGEGAAAQKTVSMLVANREMGRVRSGGDGVVLNVDGRPSIAADGRVRLILTLEYAPGGVAPMTQSMTTMLASGTPLVVSKSADPKSTRRVIAEVTATILK